MLFIYVLLVLAVVLMIAEPMKQFIRDLQSPGTHPLLRRGLHTVPIHVDFAAQVQAMVLRHARLDAMLAQLDANQAREVAIHDMQQDSVSAGLLGLTYNEYKSYEAGGLLNADAALSF
jgi:N-acyl-D-aspartate/D-glutamate deacylase